MRIILFDLLTSGHHIQYINYLNRYFMAQGDEVTFITWQPNKHIERLPISNPKFKVEYIKPANTNEVSKNILKKQLQYIQSIRYCFKYAARSKANIIQFMCIDRNEVPLFLNLFFKIRSKIPQVFAILVAPYFLHEKNENRYKNPFVFFLTKTHHNINKWALQKLLTKGFLHKLFVLSRKTRQSLLDNLPLVREDTIQTIPDPIELFKYNISKQKARKTLNLPKEIPLFLYFGGLRWNKGVDILLETIPLVKKNCLWLIAGSADDITQKDIDTLKGKLENPESVIAKLEFIPDDDVKYYYLSTDAVILPYRRVYKGTSGTLQHAAAAGKPVIVSDVGEIGQIVREEKLGIVVEPESSISLAKGIEDFLTKKDELSNDIRDRALRYAKSKDWRIMANRIRNAYLEEFKSKE